MRSFFILLLLLCFSATIIKCESEDFKDSDLYPQTIFGHWDIEGGGTLFFDQENFSASVGCNTLFGSFTLEQNKITFSRLASTLMACPEPEGIREQELAAQLDSAVLTFSLEENQAFLATHTGTVVLKLLRPENAALVNNWQLTAIRTENAISSSQVDAGTGIEFFSNGAVSIRTACNNGGGQFSKKESELSFEGLYFTEKGCEEERMRRESEFTQALMEITNYTLLRKTLTLEKEGVTYLRFQLLE